MNLFVQHIHSLWIKYLVCQSPRKESSIIGIIGMKRDWKRFDKIQYLKHWFKDFGLGLSDLIHSLIYAQSKPNALDTQKLRSEHKNKLAIFGQNLKTENLSRGQFKAAKVFQKLADTTRKLFQSKPAFHTQGIGIIESYFSSKFS